LRFWGVEGQDAKALGKTIEKCRRQKINVELLSENDMTTPSQRLGASLRTKGKGSCMSVTNKLCSGLTGSLMFEP
jgi:hypothetical protein